MAAELIVAPQVEQDLASAYGWYEGQRIGRGDEFLDCVAAALRTICRTPEVSPPIFLNYRRVLLRPFPLAVFYESLPGKVSVFGVLAISPNPKKWQRREGATPANLLGRLHQSVLILSTLLGSWLGMQAVHEFGHVLGGWLTGGQVAKVVLHPLTISRTDWVHNPRPLLVVWAGPVFGVLLPLAGWIVVSPFRRGAYLARFFAGFCCIANGTYIVVGSGYRLSDGGIMLWLGSPLWLLWLFALATVPLGVWLLHRQGRYFGLGSAHGHVSVRAAYATFSAVIVIIVLETSLFFKD
jgi:hypothetical protein